MSPVNHHRSSSSTRNNKDGYHQQQQQHNNNGDNEPRRAAAPYGSLHMRSDSTGSTRGAFGMAAPEPPPGPSRPHRRHHRKPRHHDDWMTHVVGENEPPTSYQTATPPRSLAKPSNDQEEKVLFSESPSNVTNFAAQRLETITDDSPSNSDRQHSRRGTDSLRYSVDQFSERLETMDPAGLSLLGDLSPRENTGARRFVPFDGGASSTTEYGAIAPPAISVLSAPPTLQQQDIASFSAMAMGAAVREPSSTSLALPTDDSDDNDDDDDDDTSDWTDFTTDHYFHHDYYSKVLWHLLDPTEWLLSDAVEDEQGNHYFEDYNWTLAAAVRHFLYNPLAPEFTSLQQFVWAVLIGILMGFYTAGWKYLIESGVDFVWETVPEMLLEAGFFTELDGAFPLYHYMWICPAIFGGILSYIFAALPIKIPGQNEWINAVHSKGVQDSTTFFTLFVLSTLGMLSGLSLGPELPLVLTAGMVGSWFGLLCKQSMLQARVLNLTAASAAVGGFFGFPMAGALFVLEIPHRMGLQYFEALSPATISSIAAVLTNRLVVNNDVTGYYSYPFLTMTLPSEVFTSAILYGLYGAAIGILYASNVLKLKTLVHDLFHEPHHQHDEPQQPLSESSEKDAFQNAENGEHIPLVQQKEQAPPKRTPHQPSLSDRLKAFGCVFIPHEPSRAAVAGVVAGAAVGVISMFVPHVLFWGEAQLQNLIDKGRTPLPTFGQGDDPTAALVALGRCMIDPDDPVAVKEGFSIGCSMLITVAKIVVVGLSLGTGIVGGHFWGPLFVGCSASHLLTDSVNWFADHFGFGRTLAAYPCVVILCKSLDAACSGLFLTLAHKYLMRRYHGECSRRHLSSAHGNYAHSYIDDQRL